MLEQTVLSERRACRLAGLSRDTFRHPPEPTPATQALSARIIELAQARKVVTEWRRDYNEVRPHSSCGRIPPAKFAANHRAQQANNAVTFNPGLYQ